MNIVCTKKVLTRHSPEICGIYRVAFDDRESLIIRNKHVNFDMDVKNAHQFCTKHLRCSVRT